MSYITVNPFDNKEIKSYEHHSLYEAVAAIKKLSIVQAAWRQKSVVERAEILKKVAAVLISK